MDKSSIWQHAVSRHDRMVTVTLSGELDLACCALLQAVLSDQLTNPVCERVDIDLAQVTFIDCATMATMVTARRRATGVGRTLYVVRPSGLVSRVLNMVGLLDELGAPQPDGFGGPA